MFAFLLRMFRLVWLFTRGHEALVLENVALRRQLAIYRRKKKRPRLNGGDRLILIALAGCRLSLLSTAVAFPGGFIFNLYRDFALINAVR